MSRRQSVAPPATDGPAPDPAPILDNDEQSKIVDELTKESDAIVRRMRGIFTCILIPVALLVAWRTFVLLTDEVEYAGNK